MPSALDDEDEHTLRLHRAFFVIAKQQERFARKRAQRDGR